MKPKTWTHPKFARLKRRLGSAAVAAGVLEGIWHLASTFDPAEGRVGYSGQELLDWLELDLDLSDQYPECEEPGGWILILLVECNWLDVDETGHGLVVHDWQDHKPSYLTARERQQRYRESLSRDSSATVAPPKHDSDGPSASASASVSLPKKVNKKRASPFTPPTVDEVRQYAGEVYPQLDCEDFVDSYQSSGWKKRGGAPVKDWKACVRTWKRHGWGQASNGQPRPPRTASPEHRRQIMRHRKAQEIWISHRGDPDAGEAAILKAGLQMSDLESPNQD